VFASLAGCLATRAVDESRPRVAYFPPPDPAHVREEATFTAADGAVLGYVAHRRRGGAARAAFVYLHGIESHAGWFDRAAELLCAAGADVFCLDRRGSGINRENRGFTSGHVARCEVLFADVHAFAGTLRGRYPHLWLIGLSWGGKQAVAHALVHPRDFDGLVLITPGLRARVDLRVGQKLEALLGSVLRPTAAIEIPITPEMFTETPAFLEALARDPLRLRTATARFFMVSRGLDGLVEQRIGELRLPVLVVLAGHDRIVDNPGVLELLRRVPAPLTVRTYEDQTHSVQFDAPERLVADIVAWTAAAAAGGR
jgi:alpha-beta hydrolase superfamily lysophospholipase